MRPPPEPDESDEDARPQPPRLKLKPPPRKKRRGNQRENPCGIPVRDLEKMPISERTRLCNGIVEGLCGHCPQLWRPVGEAFVPSSGAEICVRAADVLQNTIAACTKAYNNGDLEDMNKQMQIIIARRASWCVDCTGKKKPTRKQLECSAEWERLRREVCALHGGCPMPGCAEKGMSSWVCMSADHTDPKTKVMELGGTVWWSWNGGVNAMREEAQKVQWMCGCCHRLQVTSSSGQTRKPGQWESSDRATARAYEKQQYVNNHKLEIGYCQYPECGRKVTPENVRAFDWDHRDPATKATHLTHPHLVNKTKVGGVSCIVNNHAKGAALEHCKVELDAEMDKCDLLCCNCHYSRKPKKRARWDVS